MGKFPFKYAPPSRKAMATEAVVAMRIEPSESSELVSQLLWGEPIEILEEKSSWMRVQSLIDSYIGWVSEKMVEKVDDAEFEKLMRLELQILSNSSSCVIGFEQQKYLLPSGSFIYENKENGGYCHPIAGTIKFSDTLPFEQNTIVDIAQKFTNAPYLWGGKTVMGMDCSGFVQLSYRISGLFLPRDASLQATMGKTVNFITEVQPGDLAFFDNEEGLITHVGIILSGNQIIHASGKVRIDNIDHQGIYNASKGRYTHKLRIIKRITST